MMDFIGLYPTLFVRRASYALRKHSGDSYINVCVERYCHVLEGGRLLRTSGNNSGKSGGSPRRTWELGVVGPSPSHYTLIPTPTILDFDGRNPLLRHLVHFAGRRRSTVRSPLCPRFILTRCSRVIARSGPDLEGRAERELRTDKWVEPMAGSGLQQDGYELHPERHDHLAQALRDDALRRPNRRVGRSTFNDGQWNYGVGRRESHRDGRELPGGRDLGTRLASSQRNARQPHLVSRRELEWRCGEQHLHSLANLEQRQLPHQLRSEECGDVSREWPSGRHHLVHNHQWIYVSDFHTGEDDRAPQRDVRLRGR